MSEDKEIEKLVLANFCEFFYIPDIKLVGYGRSQTYQCACVKCKTLYFNLNVVKSLEDLFCGYCEANEKFLNECNKSPVNFIGNVIGWEVKSTGHSKKKIFLQL